MKRRATLAAAGIGLALPLAAKAQVVNFHDAANYASGAPYNAASNFDSVLYVGQGAYPDPGNNLWNGFGGIPPSENPPAYVFGPYVTSTGASTTIRLTANYGFDNGGLGNFSTPTGNSLNGQPGFLVGNEAGVNSGNPGAGTAAAPMGTFTLQNVPQGTYTLFLYGANYDNNRGTTFALAAANGGTADQGINSTLNDLTPAGTAITFGEGKNYVIFNNVHPDASGNINGTFIPNPADGVGNSDLSGEGSFDGLQLISAGIVPEPASIGLLGVGALGLLARRRRRT